VNTAVFLLAAAASSFGGSSAPVDPAIFRGKAAAERASFLVVLREQANLSGAGAIADRGERRRFVYESLRAVADASQRALVERLRHREVRHRSHYLVNMVEVEADEATARVLAREPGVFALAANRPSELSRVGPPDLAPRRAARAAEIEPNIVLIGAPQVWDRGFTGQGIVVGIADTGVGWRHPALIGQYRGWDGAAASHAYNWHDAIHENAALNACGVDSPEPCDDEGHGTAVAGLAVGDDGGANRIGVAPGARWIGCRNMDIGAGTPARYVECFEFFLAPTDANGENPRPELGADVVNNSWTCQLEEGCAEPEILRAAVQGLRAAGVAGVFAAGNSGPSCASLSAVPAIYDEALTVGATYLTDVIANFSARGPVTRDSSLRMKPDICAPGVSVRTSSDRSASELYEIFAGTSGASPHVAGAIALLWAAVPSLAGDVDGTEEVLEATAVRLQSAIDCGGLPGAAVPNPVFGWGRIDVAAALEALPVRGLPEPAAGPRPEARVLPARP
jgi:subtilisin family serine protease